MGHEWLLVVPLILVTGIAFVRSMVSHIGKFVMAAVIIFMVMVFLFVFPGLYSVSIVKESPYVRVKWCGGKNYVEARRRIWKYTEKKMKEKGIVIYGAESD